MAEPDDLIGKADALMARHRPGRTASASYADVPVLHEVVDMPRESDDLPVLTELVDLAEIQGVGPELHEPDPPREEQLLHEKKLLHDEKLLREEQALKATMRASALAALQPEIDALIDERLHASLAPLVEKLFADLRGELQLIARNTLTDAIKTAVERELERRKSGG